MDTTTPRHDRLERHRTRARDALERMLQRILQHGFTGSASLRLDLKQGGIVAVRITTEEVEMNREDGR